MCTNTHDMHQSEGTPVCCDDLKSWVLENVELKEMQ